MSRPFLRSTLVPLLCAALALAACSDDQPAQKATTTTLVAGRDEPTLTSAACGEPVAEQLDPASGRHLLPGQPEPTYLTDPPTSGPHKSGEYPTGVLADAIPKPVQVAMLEAGEVIIQHKDLDRAEFDRVTALATETVTVAPSPSLPGHVVATAWQVKLICTKVDEAALRAFVTTYLNAKNAH